MTEQGVGYNRYAYAANDPINRFDPNGNFFGTLFAAAVTMAGLQFSYAIAATAWAVAIDSAVALAQGADGGDVVKSAVISFATTSAMQGLRDAGVLGDNGISGFSSTESTANPNMSVSDFKFTHSKYSVVAHYRHEGSLFAEDWALSQTRLQSIQSGFEDFLDSKLGEKTIRKLTSEGRVLQVFDSNRVRGASSAWAHAGQDKIFVAAHALQSQSARMLPQLGAPLMTRISTGSIFAHEVGHAVFGLTSAQEFQAIKFYGNVFRAEKGERLRDPSFH